MSTLLGKQLPWHSRMEARVIAGTLVLVALSLAGVLLAATGVATKSAVAQGTSNLEDGRQAFYRLVDTRADNAAAQTRLIIALPIFKATIASDIPTLAAMADEYRDGLQARFAIVTNSEGNIIAAPGWRTPWQTPAPLLETISSARSSSQRNIVEIEGQLFLVVS